MTIDGLGEIRRQVQWHRLIAVVEEQAQAILRTAFGSVVREAGDLSAGVYDTRGRMLAQAVTGTPGHVNTMAAAVAHFLERFPPGSLRPGDVLVTNDPWLGTGHLFDFVVVTPAFVGDRLVGLFASTCHVADVGGRGFSAEAASVFEEGLQVPHMYLRRAGVLDDTLLTLLLANSRAPVEVRGDLFSLVAANDTGVRRLQAMMAEFALESLDELAAMIIENSRTAMLERIAALPAGVYGTEMRLDGFDEPVHLRACLRIASDGLRLDYAGTSPASRRGINSPLCYTEAYSCFGLKCIIAPDVPNNAGSLSVFTVIAPEGCAVNPLRPSPVTARHVIGQMLPDVAFGCLAGALPGRVPAESAGSIWVLPFGDAGTRADERFVAMSVGIGGIGARPGKDGMACTAFPSGVGAIPVEVTELETPLVFWQKAYAPDSGGAGQYRGGLGQDLEIGHRDGHAFTVSAATWDRLDNPARGRDGAADGGRGIATLSDGTPLPGKAVHTVPDGQRLRLRLPGGGGLGNPAARDPDAIRRDLALGFVTPGGARRDYGFNPPSDDGRDD
ncbi:MAG: hydantoinase B/oxoprolinase family protein [Burkholderiaceae bacterium]